MAEGKRLELLAPAGGPEQLRCATHFGADAVYLAGRRWGMRAQANNFSDEELAWATCHAHGRGVRVHLALNTLMDDDDLRALPERLELIDALGIDALIVSDLGALALARRHAPHVALHLSTQASVTNAAAALEYARLGVSRIVLARELGLGQIARMHGQLGDAVELEAFVHGSMCVAYSGRCLLSAHLMGRARSAAHGGCAQPCRWAWHLNEERDPTIGLELEQDARGSYLLSANDLCMVEHLDELAEAGVRAAKIEGRAKGSYYVAVTTNAYRRALDGADPAECLRELEATSHRPFSTGFYFGDPTQNPGRVDYARNRLLVAVITACDRCDDGYRIELVCRNRADAGHPLVALSPGQPARPLDPDKIARWDGGLREWVREPALVRNGGRYRLLAPFPLEPGDLLCADA